MATNIAEYYTDELLEWNRQILFSREELDELTKKLAMVIQRNTIPNIAAKVENEQDKINAVSQKFYRLEVQIQQQLKAFKTNGNLIANADINAEAEKQQNKFRQSMQETEKEYVDTKYACYNFLSDTLKK
jgi:hypothetical protein